MNGAYLARSCTALPGGKDECPYWRATPDRTVRRREFLPSISLQIPSLLVCCVLGVGALFHTPVHFTRTSQSIAGESISLPFLEALKVDNLECFGKDWFLWLNAKGVLGILCPRKELCSLFLIVGTEDSQESPYFLGCPFDLAIGLGMISISQADTPSFSMNPLHTWCKLGFPVTHNILQDAKVSEHVVE